MLGLQTAVGVVIQAMVETGLLDWAGLADRMSVRPARIGRVAGHGRPLAVGEPANLTVIDPEASWQVDPGALASLSRNTPFAGRVLPGRVQLTMLRGAITVRDGVLAPAGTVLA
jgi:dihydroorotase